MKKSLLALAVLGAYAGVASAQSSVTLYGTIDLNGRYVKNTDSKRRFSLSQDGINSSQLGFRGIEDLGGGLKAGFTLLSGVNADTGSTNAKFFNRRSTLSLFGNFGEVRLGRDYVPTFWNTTIFDVFGTNGLGDSSSVKQIASSDYVRADNAIGYFLPSNIGGVYGQFMAAAGENAAPGRYLGGRVGFAAGPFDVAVAYSRQRLVNGVSGAGGYVSNVVNPGLTAGQIGGNGSGEQYRSFNVGASFDLTYLKIMGYFNQDRVFGLKDNMGSLSVLVPIGQGEVHAGIDYSKLSGPVDNKVKKAALGYVYNLSKRTAIYGTASYVDNDDRTSLQVGGIAAGAAGSTSANGIAGSGSVSAAPSAGGKSKGAEIGVRHFF